MYCNMKAGLEDKYCSSCGRELPKTINTVPLSRKIKIYLMSVFLAPFGIYWFFKYFRSTDEDKRKLGFYCLYITIVMVIILVIVNYFFIKSVNSYVNNYNFSIYGL